MTYVTYVYGFPVFKFQLHTLFAALLFRTLDISAVLVLAGIFRSLGGCATRARRRCSRSPRTSFRSSSSSPSAGLALTASQEWLRGEFYSFLAIIHAITVIAALLYLPFGKFFHIFQRPAQLGVRLYEQAGEGG